MVIITTADFASNDALLMKSSYDRDPNVTTKSKPIEKRLYPRIETTLPVHFWIDFGANRTERSLAYTENLSVAGMLLRCEALGTGFMEKLIRTGARLGLNFKLTDDGENLSASGRVVRARADDGSLLLGVRFTELDQENQDRIHRFMLLYPPLSSPRRALVGHRPS